VLHHDAGATLIPELCGRGRCEENSAMGAPTREANLPSPELLRGGGAVKPRTAPPWKPALLRKDADAVYPEDRSASAAMDALNVDHHLFGRMPER
jgi:hypothetical protein